MATKRLESIRTQIEMALRKTFKEGCLQNKLK